MKLTKSTIENLNPPEKGYTIFWDDQLKGFGIRVLASGTRSYVIDYRTRSGRHRRMTIGRNGVWTPKTARKKAQQILNELASGDDPLQERNNARNGDRFKYLAKLYIEQRCSKKKSGSEDKRIIEKSLLKPWSNISPKEISKQDIFKVIDKISRRGSLIMANRTLSVIKRIFNFAVDRGILEMNPAWRIKNPNREHSSKRVLKETEIKIFWDTVDNMEGVSSLISNALKLILITGQRSGEVISMEWAEINLTSGWWEQPGEKTKNGIAHRIPLSPLALEVLSQIKQSNKFVFPGRVGTGHSNNKHITRNAISQAILKNRELFKMEKITPHDLRRTAASHIAGLGFSRIVIQKILNHSERSVTGVYDRYEYQAEKETALGAWSRKLINIIEGEKGKIRPIIRGKSKTF